MKNTFKFALIISLFVLPCVAQASVTYEFSVITSNSPIYGPLIADQIFVDISPEISGQVSFTFRNIGPFSSSISEIYFDDGAILESLDEIISDGNVSFTANEFSKVSPKNLPGGNMVDPAFVATASLSSDADPGNANGVNPGEYVKLVFSLYDETSYSDLIQSLELPAADPENMRIGIHVRSIDPYGSQSESYLNSDPLIPPSPIVVPVPGAFLLGGMGVGILGFVRIRRIF